MVLVADCRCHKNKSVPYIHGQREFMGHLHMFCRPLQLQSPGPHLGRHHVLDPGPQSRLSRSQNHTSVPGPDQIWLRRLSYPRRPLFFPFRATPMSRSTHSRSRHPSDQDHTYSKTLWHQINDLTSQTETLPEPLESSMLPTLVVDKCPVSVQILLHDGCQEMIPRGAPLPYLAACQ